MKFSTPSLFIVIAIAFCCSEEEPDSSNTSVEYEAAITPVGTPAADPITKTIGTSGGSIASPDGVMELVIPAGALAANTDITIQPLTNEAPGGIGLSYNLLPDGTTFSKPATLTFHHTDEDINGSSPLFLYIAYQDVDNTWVSDLKNQHLDTLAKTISLDISHFTIFSQGTDHPKISAGMLNLKAGESTHLAMMETFVITTPQGDTHTESYPVPANLISDWKVNFSNGGNPTDGTIEGTGTMVVYHAPQQIDRRRTVKISAHVNVTFVMIYRGRQTTIRGTDPTLEITLEPTPPRKYHILIDYVDSLVSPFYGRKGATIPVYHDKAKFDLAIEFNRHGVAATISNVQNQMPTVTPATIGYDGTDFVWVPDSIGKVNIDSVVPNYGVDEDFIVRFDVGHKGTMQYGVILQSSENGEIYQRSEPTPYGSSIGFPMLFDVDLKRRDAYFDPSQSIRQGGGIHTYVSIVPAE